MTVHKPVSNIQNEIFEHVSKKTKSLSLEATKKKDTKSERTLDRLLKKIWDLEKRWLVLLIENDKFIETLMVEKLIKNVEVRPLLVAELVLGSFILSNEVHRDLVGQAVKLVDQSQQVSHEINLLLEEVSQVEKQIATHGLPQKDNVYFFELSWSEEPISFNQAVELYKHNPEIGLKIYYKKVSFIEYCELMDIDLQQI